MLSFLKPAWTKTKETLSSVGKNIRQGWLSIGLGALGAVALYALAYVFPILYGVYAIGGMVAALYVAARNIFSTGSSSKTPLETSSVETEAETKEEEFGASSTAKMNATFSAHQPAANDSPEPESKPVDETDHNKVQEEEDTHEEDLRNTMGCGI